MATRRAVLGGGLVGRGKGPCSLALPLSTTPAPHPASRALFSSSTTATTTAPTAKRTKTPSPRTCAVPVPRRPGTSLARPGLGLRLRRPYSSGADAAGQKEGEGQRAPSGSRIWSFEEVRLLPLSLLLPPYPPTIIHTPLSFPPFPSHNPHKYPTKH